MILVFLRIVTVKFLNLKGVFVGFFCTPSPAVSDTCSFDSTTDSICMAPFAPEVRQTKGPRHHRNCYPLKRRLGWSRFQWFLGVLFCLFVALFGWLLGWFSCFAVCVFGWLVAFFVLFFLLCVGLVGLGCLVELLVVECVNNKN